MKPIRFSQHVRRRMILRGATEAEIIATIRDGVWQPARTNKQQARKAFPFGQSSPVKRKVYAFKIVNVIFVDEPDEIVVVTVFVYYGNQETKP